MSVRQFRLPLLVLLLPLGAACTHELAFPVAPGERLRLVVRKGDAYCERALVPGSSEYRTFQVWIRGNTRGWDAYLATDPSDGTAVSAADWQISFANGAALATTAQGMYLKSVNVQDYQYLTCPMNPGR